MKHNWIPEEWERTERVHLKALKEWAESSGLAPCAICRMIQKKRESLGEFRAFEPSDPKVRARMRGPAVYVVCKKCMGLPKDVQEEKVMAFFVDRDGQVDASQRLFEAEAEPAAGTP